MATPATAVYLRQSRDSEGNELAIDRQRDGCLTLCRQKGWNDIREYPDNDRSASNGKTREKYQQMLKDIAAGKVARVVVWDLDRLHRQPIELEHFMKLADDHRLKLATVTGDVDLATDNGRLFARIKGAVGMAEVERKSARQKAAAKQKATNKDGGRPAWPSRPFGFDAKSDPVTGKWWTAKRNPTVYNEIRLHETEAKLMRDAYSRFLAGTKLYEIAMGWNKAGVATPRGGTWSGTRVRELLLLARNAGLREYHGEVVGEGTWPAIVTEETWRAAHAKITHPDRRTGTFKGRKYLLSGIALCGHCGHALTSHVSNRGKRQYGCYKCRKVSRGGEQVDALITEMVVRRLAREDAVDLVVTDDEEVDANALREQRRELEQGLVRLGRDFATAPAAFRQSALDETNEKLAAIDAQLTDAVKVDVFEGVIGAEDVAAAFGGLGLGRRRTIVDALMTITVLPVGKRARVFDPDYIDVVWKEDL
ncbi:recombinase family protein [Mycobacterium sp.]|uniref:recombinase family protein n=1 Tax=Mycobacterium sp. TaxID=1785 RepID=UPI003BAE9D6C